MNHNDARAFAERWSEAWNRRDLESVLSLFDDDIVFTSPRALQVVGSPTVRGKSSLRAYWTASLQAVTSLRFVLDRVVWDHESRELAIIYISELDGETKRVSENLRFGEHGSVIAAEVFHGAKHPN